MANHQHHGTGHHGCYVAPITKAYDRERLHGRAVARLQIAGMGCPNCAARVHNALLALDGVIEADVSLSPQHATVTFDPSRTLPEELTEAVYWAGATTRHRYEAQLIVVVDTLDASSRGDRSSA